MNYAQKTIALLKEKGDNISTAESVTGGGIANSYIKVSGASSVFYEGFVTYDFLAKRERLGVADYIKQTYGVISCECAKAMVNGVIKNSHCDYAVAITGVAQGVVEGQIAGTAFLGLASKTKTETFRLKAKGSRKQIIRKFIKQALCLTYKFINQNPNKEVANERR